MRIVPLFLVPLVITLTTSSILCASETGPLLPSAESSHAPLLQFDGAIQEEVGKTRQESDELEEFGEVSDDLPMTYEFEGLVKIPRSLQLSKVEESEETIKDPFESEEPLEPLEPEKTIADPLEPINRAFYHFNDKLYFWLLKPVATGYKAIAPEPVRVSVRNFFHNLLFPIRFVNCLFQAKFQRAGDELTRFLVNTTVGIVGFYDVAAKKMDIKAQEEDLGQTFGVYGLGPGFFINWPIIGPSSLRDSFGLLGDGFLNPVNYAGDFEVVFAVRAYDTVNKTSLTIGDYESLKEAALDPYIAIRDAYYQFRQNRVKE